MSGSLPVSAVPGGSVMPYHVVENSVRCPASRPHAVVKDADGTVMGCHESVAAARRQIAALHASEDDQD